MSRDLKSIVIAIDGPAGAGKSTVSKALAADLGLFYLNTGAMYRALALKTSRVGVPKDDGAAIAKLMESTQITFGHGNPQPILLDGEDVTSTIAGLDVSDLASEISALTPVRQALVARQKQFVAKGGVILEGRDATTVIAPEADVKVYLTASLEERAKRRTIDLESGGKSADFRHVRQQMEVRDHRDIMRDDSPLTVAPDAVIIESAGLTVAEVVAKIKELALKA